MVSNPESKLVFCHEQIIDELYVADTIVNMTINACQSREFNGQYYGTSGKDLAELSAERNNYINMLTILAEKISNILDLNISLEREILLQQNAYNSSRKITTQSSADKSS